MKTNVKKRSRAVPYHKFLLYSLLFLFMGISALLINQIQVRQTQKSNAATYGNDCSITNGNLMIISPEEKNLLDLINNYRATKHIAPFTWDTTLKKTAVWMSSQMLRNKSTNSIDEYNRNTQQRLNDCGYTSPLFGEALGSSEANAADIFTMWKNSDAYNSVLIDPNLTLIGISLQSDSTKMANYWALEAGSTTKIIASPTPTRTATTPTPTQKITPTISPKISVSPTQPVLTPTTLIPTNISISTTVAPTPTNNLSITPTDAPYAANMQLKFTIKIQGIGSDGNASPQHLTRKVDTVVYGKGEEAGAKGTGYLTYDGKNYFTGVVNLGRLQEGIYYIKVNTYGAIFMQVQPEFQKLYANRVNEMPAVTLVMGDINIDNALSIDDYNLALACFQDKKCQTPELIDFNDDTVTDVKDYNMLLQSFQTLKGK